MTRKTPRNPEPARAPGAVLTLGFVFAFVFAGAAWPLAAADFSEWKFRQSLALARPGVVSVRLPAATLDAARADHGDIRIVDAVGRELAFALRTGTRPALRPAPVRSFHSTLTATTTQLLLDGGDVPLAAITLETPAADFVKRARIESSADGSTWVVAAEGVPFFRQGGITRLGVPVLARHLRLTLDDMRSRPVPFTGASILPAAPGAHARVPLPARLVQREEFAGETVLTVELAAAHAPLDTLTLLTPERLFTRQVTVGVRELQDASAIERLLARGTIYQLALDDDPGRATGDASVPLGFTAPSRELLVHIANDDSPPLAITGIEFSRFESTLIFDAPAAGDYALLTGQPQAAAPHYDVARLRLGPSSALPVVEPGPHMPNPGHRPPEALAGTPLLGAALDPAPWTYRKAVHLTAPGVHQLELDLDVLAHASPAFADLRLLRDGAQVPYLLERPALARALDLPVVAAPDPKRPTVSRWELALPRAGLPLTRLTLQSPTPLFQRQLHVLERLTDDRGNTRERILATVTWSRTPGDRRPLVLPLATPPASGLLIVETDNGDNPPIVLATAAAAHPVTRLLFKADPAPLALYYGHRAAAPPRYDLALVADRILSAEKRVATLAAEERVRPEGWTRTMLGGGRGGILFWSVLAFVVLVLLAIVAKLLPKAPAPPA